MNWADYLKDAGREIKRLKASGTSWLKHQGCGVTSPAAYSAPACRVPGHFSHAPTLYSGVLGAWSAVLARGS